MLSPSLACVDTEAGAFCGAAALMPAPRLSDAAPARSPALEQLKQGEIHSTVFATAVLTGKEYALEIQINAYSLLHHLVRRRARAPAMLHGTACTTSPCPWDTRACPNART